MPFYFISLDYVISLIAIAVLSMGTGMYLGRRIASKLIRHMRHLRP